MPAKHEAAPQVHPIPPLFDESSRVLTYVRAGGWNISAFANSFAAAKIPQ